MPQCPVAECDGKTYGIGCHPCSENCRNSMCNKFSETMICSDGCIAGKMGKDCSQGEENLNISQ